MRRLAFLLLALLWLTLLPGASSAQVAVSGSPDTHLSQGRILIRPGDVSSDIEVLAPAPLDLGPLPVGADVIAYALAGPTRHYFVLGHALVLPGGVTAGPRDIVRWDGAAYTLEVDGAAVGFPDGTVIDALSFDPLADTAWFSFQSPIDFFGTLLREADVVDAQTFAKAFDATAAGVPAGMNVDAVSQLPPSNDVLLSFDTGGTLGGVTFADEDVLRYDPDTRGFTLVVDTSVADPEWEAANLDAIEVPEPGAIAQLAAGAALLAVLARSRNQKRRSS